jgi:hypothetical protein
MRLVDASSILRMLTTGGVNYLQTGTALSADSKADLRITSMFAGTLYLRVNTTTGKVENGSGQNFAVEGVLSAPSGTRLLLGNASVPTGWSIVASLADKTILTTSTASEIDDTGGSWTVSGLSGSTTVGGHALTIAEMPAHDHASPGDFGFYVGMASAGSRATAAAGTTNSYLSPTASTGGGASHSHTASTSVSSSGAWRPAYYKAGWIAKS